MRTQKSTSSFALCIRDDGAEDLEQRKLYRMVADREAAREGYVRVIDESGEDYLYPSELFVTIRLPVAVARRLMRSSPTMHAAARRPGRLHRSRRARRR